MTQALAFPGNVCLMGEHGGIVFAQRQLGLYEAHTSILPSGRGAWALSAVRAMLHWMFNSSGTGEC